MIVGNGVDVTAAADHGGWKSRRLLMETYVRWGWSDRLSTVFLARMTNHPKEMAMIDINVKQRLERGPIIKFSVRSKSRRCPETAIQLIFDGRTVSADDLQALCFCGTRTEN